MTNRRSVLTSIGALSIASISGCLEAFNHENQDRQEADQNEDANSQESEQERESINDEIQISDLFFIAYGSIHNNLTESVSLTRETTDHYYERNFDEAVRSIETAEELVEDLKEMYYEEYSTTMQSAASESEIIEQELDVLENSIRITENAIQSCRDIEELRSELDDRYWNQLRSAESRVIDAESSIPRSEFDLRRRLEEDNQ